MKFVLIVLLEWEHFATLKGVIPKGTASKYLRSTFISPDGKTQIQIDGILKDWSWHGLDALLSAILIIIWW